jgi:hypothetical protein
VFADPVLRSVAGESPAAGCMFSMLAALRQKVKGQLDMGVMQNAHGSSD